MIEIVPAINVDNFAEVERRIRMVESHATRVHIDVADGTFTKTVTWNTPEDLQNLSTDLEIEIHFMVDDPEEKLLPWLTTDVRRVLFHLESTTKANEIIDNLHNVGKEAGVCIRPDTSVEALHPFIDNADLVQTLAVMPGPSNQSFDEGTLKKIESLRAAFPDKDIEVDGGMRPGVASVCAHAGANYLVAASWLFNGEMSFDEALAKLKDDISH
ncbi:MAG: hypothetical protein O2794_00805 [bacterium]|nr:hypothetical protein [bacterium]